MIKPFARWPSNVIVGLLWLVLSPTVGQSASKDLDPACEKIPPLATTVVNAGQDGIGVYARDHCYWERAKATAEIKYCNNVADGHLKSRCHEDVMRGKRRIEICQKVRKEDRDLCYYQYINETKDTSACNKIKDKKQSSLLCKDNKVRKFQ